MWRRYAKGMEEDLADLQSEVAEQKQIIKNLKYEIKDQFVHVSEYQDLYDKFTNKDLKNIL
jgi:uncharacterized coiled-coil protein SlyX